jgi:pimeloyl-ACP methyl ester carboxylesterase
MPFIDTADRTSLFVTDWGSGPPVVFTHAWGLRDDQWNYQIPRARRRWAAVRAVRPARPQPVRPARHRRPARLHQRPPPPAWPPAPCPDLRSRPDDLT